MLNVANLNLNHKKGESLLNKENFLNSDINRGAQLTMSESDLKAVSDLQTCRITKKIILPILLG
jgi:hypothetical protein